MARYEAGETLSSIARTYDCSPPAISYVISRSRARQSNHGYHGHPQPATEAPRPPVIGEPQLIKASAANAGDHTAHREPAASAPAIAPPAPLPSGSELRPGNGQGHVFAQASDPRAAHAPAHDDHRSPGDPRAATSDPRGRLHLALGNGNGSHPNAGSHETPHSPERHAPPPQPYRPAPPNQHPEPQHANGGHLGNGVPPASQPEQRKEAHGAFIDRELRGRVEADITAFLAAFDAALAEDSPDSRTALREATDRLLRAGARTRIELERLEARTPLPHRDAARPSEAWRQR